MCLNFFSFGQEESLKISHLNVKLCFSHKWRVWNRSRRRPWLAAWWSTRDRSPSRSRQYICTALVLVVSAIFTGQGSLSRRRYCLFTDREVNLHDLFLSIHVCLYLYQILFLLNVLSWQKCIESCSSRTCIDFFWLQQLLANMIVQIIKSKIFHFFSKRIRIS